MLRIIQRIEAEVQRLLAKDAGGHDWWHIQRVYKMALRLAKAEGGNRTVIALAALLHDVADYKVTGGDFSAGSRVARTWLRRYKVNPEIIDRVASIVDEVSFKGAGVKTKPKTLEGKIVQDADRLDAIGAIAIARTFAYGAKIQRPIYDPRIKPQVHRTAKDYYRRGHNQSTSLNHFYEKLLLLRSRLNTKTAKRIARHRHHFMQQYLKEFFSEWRGKT